MTQRISKSWFEKVKAYHGYKPYHKYDRIDFISGKHWIVWAFHEIPGEYHELVKAKVKP
jgi:hypothetical protein